MSADKTLVQTRLPDEVYVWVKAQADAGGESVASWLRRNLMHAYNTRQPAVEFRLVTEVVR